MKKHIDLIVASLSFGIVASLAPTSHVQNQTGISKLQAISLQLILTPTQKAHPGRRRSKVEAIKNDSSSPKPSENSTDQSHPSLAASSLNWLG